MKDGIHPQYHKAKVTCSCGNTFEVGSTAEEINVEICSACHPFFTGKEKLIDTAGRVDRFKAKMEAAEKYKTAKAEKATKAEIPTSEAVGIPTASVGKHKDK